MRRRRHDFRTTVVYAIGLAGIATAVFFMINAGINPRARPPGLDDVNPSTATSGSFMVLGAFHVIAILFYVEDDTPKKDRAATDPHDSKKPDSFTGFIRQPWYKVLSVGPISAAFCAASIFIWHSFAKFPGSPGTVWGDYSTSPASALTVFLLCWASTNIGFTFASICEAFNRDLFGLTILSGVIMAILALVIGLGFTDLPKQPTESALTMAAIALPLTLLTVIGVRAWAVARVARIDANRPRPSTQETQRSTQFGSDHHHRPAPGQPPFDMLRDGERVLMHFNSERSPQSQLLIATDQRFVRASILGSDRTSVLDQASPSQLTGASSRRVGRDLMTTAHFRDRQDMQVIGGDPEHSREFAEAVTRLAQTGQIRS
ncbi:MAG: hypothetical protein L0H43_07970 [Brevibacterium aurantiacum]|nr:hypothetical protein [Brevibacterium aurantiacum]